MNRYSFAFLILLFSQALFGQTPYKNTLPKPDLIRGPYLQVATPGSIMIRWRTADLCRSRVRFGLQPGKLTEIADDSALVTEHKVIITHLEPQTKYYYSVGAFNDTLAMDDNCYFKTLPSPGKEGVYRIGAFGDCGTNSVLQRNVRDAFLKYLGKNYLDAWLLLGDNAYENGTDAQYQPDFFNVYKDDMLKRYPLFPAPGNHDYGNVDFKTNASTGRMFDIAYYQNFSVPTEGQSGGVPSHNPAYYSFDIGNVHFLSLDSYGREQDAYHLSDTLSPQVEWIKKDLAANKNKWVVTYWHHPPYTMGTHNSDKEQDLVKIRERFIRILERYGVDVVLCGHSHLYERSGLMRGYYGMESDFDSAKYVLRPTYTKDATNQGTVYIVAGSAGKIGTAQASYPHNAMRFSDKDHGGALIFEAYADKLDIKWICADGVIRDQFTIKK